MNTRSRPEIGSTVNVSGAPADVVVFPAGTVRTTKYQPYTVDAAAAQQVIGKFAALGRDMLIDFDHASLDEEALFGGNAPAAGWIKALRFEPSRGIVATVEWTERARAMIAAKEYRYLSPVYFCDDARRLSELWQVTLTNDPATIGAVPLVASRTPNAKGNAMQELAKALGQAPDATPQQLADAVNEANVAAAAAALGMSPNTTIDEVKAMIATGKSGGGGGGGGGQAPAIPAGEDSTRRIARELGLPETASADALIAAAKTKFVDVATHNRVTERLAALEGKETQRDFEAACNTPENRGKVHNANREHLRKLFDTDKAAFDGLLKTLPVTVTADSQLIPGGAEAAAGGNRFFPDMNKVRENIAKRK